MEEISYFLFQFLIRKNRFKTSKKPIWKTGASCSSATAGGSFVKSVPRTNRLKENATSNIPSEMILPVILFNKIKEIVSNKVEIKNNSCEKMASEVVNDIGISDMISILYPNERKPSIRPKDIKITVKVTLTIDLIQTHTFFNFRKRFDLLEDSLSKESITVNDILSEFHAIIPHSFWNTLNFKSSI